MRAPRSGCSKVQRTRTAAGGGTRSPRKNHQTPNAAAAAQTPRSSSRRPGAPALTKGPLIIRAPAGRSRLGLDVQFLEVDVLEPELVAMMLQFDRPLRRHRRILLPDVLHRGVIDDEDVVEEHGHLFAVHEDMERIPLADGPVGLPEGDLALA